MAGPGSRRAGRVGAGSGSGSGLGSSSTSSPPNGVMTFRGRPRGRLAGGGTGDVVSIGVVLSTRGSGPLRFSLRTEGRRDGLATEGSVGWIGGTSALTGLIAE